jgi:hypothetical protein
VKIGGSKTVMSCLEKTVMSCLEKTVIIIHVFVPPIQTQTQRPPPTQNTDMPCFRPSHTNPAERASWKRKRRDAMDSVVYLMCWRTPARQVYGNIFVSLISQHRRGLKKKRCHGFSCLFDVLLRSFSIFQVEVRVVILLIALICFWEFVWICNRSDTHAWLSLCSSHWRSLFIFFYRLSWPQNSRSSFFFFHIYCSDSHPKGGLVLDL